MYCIWMDSWTSDHYLSSSARKFCFFCLGLVIRLDTLKISRYPKSVKKWVKMQVEQVYSLLFFGIFDDFAKFCFNFGIFCYENSSNMQKTVFGTTLVRHYLQLVINISEPMKHWRLNDMHSGNGCNVIKAYPDTAE